MIQLIITSTGKSYGSKDDYRIFDDDLQRFDGIEDAEEYLQETYNNCKKVKMYRDKQDGTVKQTGWIYCFNNADYSHAPVNHWKQQDWVEFQEVKTMSL